MALALIKKLTQYRERRLESDDKSHVVALDIGTEYIKALIARIDNDTLTVVGVGKTHQQVSDMHAGAIADIAAVVQNCEDALAQAEEQAALQAKRVVIGIAGELVKGMTHTIRYRRPQAEKPLDEAEMEFIIEKVQERARDRAQQAIARETGNDAIEVKLVNSALVSMHIDGYKVSNPIGFSGKDVAVQLYTAFAPMVHIGALEKVADELALDLLAVAAEPFAVSRSVLGNDASSTFTAILVDIGGGTTDIAVVNDGGVEGTQMFGIGGRSFTRTIANDHDLSYEDAEKLKVHLKNDKLKQNVRQDIELSIQKTLEVWLAGVALALSEFQSVDHLPPRLLLCGGGSSLPHILEALQQHAWHEDLPFTKQPSVQLLLPGDVAGIVDRTGDASDHTFITAMGLLRVGYDTIVGGNTTDSMKEKLNRMLRV